MSGRATKKKTPTTRSGRAPKGSAEARRRVSAVLEVLAGAMTPGVAAEVLGCSAQRYYGLEAQALAGMLAACEPRPRGRTRTPERELEALKKEYAELERECARYRALCRAAQRAAGVSPNKVRQAKARPTKRKRKPTVRALKLSKRLRDEGPGAAAGASVALEGGGNGAGTTT